MVALARRAFLLAAAVLGGLLPATPAAAQTAPTARSGAYTAADEAALGREAAAVIRGHLATVADGSVNVYVRDLARRLAAAIPPELVQREFDYSVAVLNDGDLTSVSLPGGPVFISRGMIELAPSEAALAGLIAHELSHVALRHATAQAMAGERYQLGAITGRLIGETFSDHAAGIFDRGMQFPATAYFLTYHAEHERQANLLTERIMARRGYDPYALTTMMQTIALEVLRGGARWMWRHPAPTGGGEAGYGQAPGGEPEIAGLAPPVPQSPALALIQLQVRAWPPGRQNAEAPHARPAPLGSLGRGVLVPSGESRSVPAGDLLRLSVPADWRRLSAGNTVVFAPEGAYLSSPDAPLAVTHGMQVGVSRSHTGDLQGDAQTLLASVGRGNAYFAWAPAFRKVTIAGRPGVATTASNVSPVTGEFEHVSVSAVHLPDGSLLWVVGVAPHHEDGVYTNAFTRVLASIQILD